MPVKKPKSIFFSDNSEHHLKIMGEVEAAAREKAGTADLRGKTSNKYTTQTMGTPVALGIMNKKKKHKKSKTKKAKKSRKSKRVRKRSRGKRSRRRIKR